MNRLYLAKHRDTFHFRGTLKKLGMKFDGDRRLWYAETQEQLDAALKLLKPQPEPPSQGTTGSGETHQTSAGTDQCPECGFTGGEHSPTCMTGEAAQDAAADASASGSGSGQGSSEGEGEGESDQNGSAPFATFVQTLATTMQSAAAAASADVVLAKQLSKLAKQSNKAEAEKQKQAVEKQIAAMQDKVDKAIAQATSVEPKQVTIKVKDAPAVTIDGATPDWVADMVGLLTIGMNVRLVGPAGCGKSHGAKLGAMEIMKRRFGFVNFSDGVDESHLYGFRDITDGGTKYVVPQLCFADLYENGGIWLGDEYDRGNPNVIVSLNGALANGHLSLPKRAGHTIANKHAEFGCIVTMNTWGTGPSAQYTSANRLDESSLDRFRMGTIYVDYNRKLEASLLPDKALLGRIWKLRDRVQALGLQRVISTRFVADAARVQAELDWSPDRILAQALLGWSEHDKQKVGTP